MRRFFEGSTAAVCMTALVFATGCSDGGDQQQVASSGAAPAAPVAKKVTLQMSSAFPTSLALIGEAAGELAQT